MNKGAHTS